MGTAVCLLAGVPSRHVIRRDFTYRVPEKFISYNKQQLFPYTAFIEWSFLWKTLFLCEVRMETLYTI
jgi:hypothetical protein